MKHKLIGQAGKFNGKRNTVRNTFTIQVTKHEESGMASYAAKFSCVTLRSVRKHCYCYWNTGSVKMCIDKRQQH